MGVTPHMRAMLRNVVEVQTIQQERISVLEVPQLQIQEEVVEVTQHPPPKRISESIVEQLMLLRKRFVNNDLRTGRWRALLLVVSAAISAVSTPVPFTGSSRRACSGCSSYC